MQLVGIMRLAEEVVERGSVVLPINNIGRSLMQSSIKNVFLQNVETLEIRGVFKEILRTNQCGVFEGLGKDFVLYYKCLQNRKNLPVFPSKTINVDVPLRVDSDWL